MDFKQVEVKVSTYFHCRTIPVLISQVMLRKISAGQVDVAFFYREQLFLVEVKNSKYPRAGQLKRLRKSQNLLSQIFNCETILLGHNEKKNHLTIV